MAHMYVCTWFTGSVYIAMLPHDEVAGLGAHRCVRACVVIQQWSNRIRITTCWNLAAFETV